MTLRLVLKFLSWKFSHYQMISQKKIIRIGISNDKNISQMDALTLFTKHMSAHVDSIQLVFAEN